MLMGWPLNLDIRLPGFWAQWYVGRLGPGAGPANHPASHCNFLLPNQAANIQLVSFPASLDTSDGRSLAGPRPNRTEYRPIHNRSYLADCLPSLCLLVVATDCDQAEVLLASPEGLAA